MGIPKHTGYSAAKHAVQGFLEALELEVGSAVRFLNVMPGWIKGTDLRANAFGGDGGPLAAARGQQEGFRANARHNRPRRRTVE